MLPKRSADNITRSYCRHYYTEFLSNCCLLNLRKLCESNNFVQISCNVKGLVFDFYLNRKRNKCWLTAPGGVLPYKGLMGTCGQPGYVFRDFCLKQGIKFIIFCLKEGIDLSIFVLNRMSFLGR